MSKLVFILALAALAVGCQARQPVAQNPDVLDVGSDAYVEEPEFASYEPAFEPAGEPAADETLFEEPAEPEYAAPATFTHDLAKGETFYGLATIYLGSGKRWREIAELNPTLDPNKLPVGTPVVIPNG